MKPILICLSFVVALSTASCVLGPGQRPSSENPERLLAWGIKKYNAGSTSEAESALQSVVETSQTRELGEIRAVAHFYLAAVAWDFGKKGDTDLHLRQCLDLRPNYQPDWTYVAPEFRQRFELLRP